MKKAKQRLKPATCGKRLRLPVGVEKKRKGEATVETCLSRKRLRQPVGEGGENKEKKGEKAKRQLRHAILGKGSVHRSWKMERRGRKEEEREGEP
ncbi:hypothetical protein AMTR_s00097p00170910 [Amborella trichopoda]|uniref:Uncharacterized protein n=1 Tax=Amborella trichopoda TaxID=13333 RepID=W1P1I2_AMBTC|nr:hypothetical protein AMTR_s00097p00170910 [Amborella trichopoda]